MSFWRRVRGFRISSIPVATSRSVFETGPDRQKATTVPSLASRHVIAALVIGCLLSAGLATQSATAAQTYDSIVSANPANTTPNVEDKAVKSITKVGSTMVAGGTFTQVTPPGGPTLSRSGIFAFNATTGAVSSTFQPQFNAVVNRVVSAGDGTSVYVAGKFSMLNGSPVSKVVRLDVTTGQPVPGFKAPALNGQVWDMVLQNGRLYVGGAFTKVGTTVKSGLVALDPATGKDTQQITASFADTFNGGTVAVKELDVASSGRYLVAIGNFRTVNGQSRVQIAMFNTDVAPATLATWSTSRYSTSCSGSFDSYMRDVSIAPDGSYFAVATTGAFAGGVGSGTLCDAATRWEFLPDSAGQNPTWVDYTGGDTLFSIMATGRSIYLGGHQRWLNNPFRGDAAGEGAVKRSGIAVLDARNGLPFSWNPGRQRGVGLREFLPLPEGLWVAHDTDRLGQEERKRIAFLPLAGGKAIPPDNTGTLPGDTYSLGSATTTDDTVTRRSMTTTGVTASATVANGGQDWSSSRGSFMVDGKLFTGWSNGTLTVRTFDGTTFGAPATVNLNGMTTFAAELPNVTGMFFDRATARLYYTVSGQSTLYYRYFLPESQIVGAVRFTGPAAPAGISWSQAGGMFLAGDRLFVSNRVDGTLRSVQWLQSAPTGAVTQVSGPGVDANVWNTRSVFLYAP